VVAPTGGADSGSLLNAGEQLQTFPYSTPSTSFKRLNGHVCDDVVFTSFVVQKPYRQKTKTSNLFRPP